MLWIRTTNISKKRKDAKKKYNYLRIGIIALFLCFIIFSKQLAIFTINFYQLWLSPLKNYRCAYSTLNRGKPSCSEYGKQVIQKFGSVRGSILIKERFDDCRKAAEEFHNSACFNPMVSVSTNTSSECDKSCNDCVVGCEEIVGDCSKGLKKEIKKKVDDETEKIKKEIKENTNKVLETIKEKLKALIEELKKLFKTKRPNQKSESKSKESKEPKIISKFHMPLKNIYIVDNNDSLSFNANSSKLGRHKGIDYLTSNKNTAVYSVTNGTVKLINTDRDNYKTKFRKYWNAFIIIEHKNEKGIFYEYYGHLNNSENLSKNDKVKKGQKIGEIRNAYKCTGTIKESECYDSKNNDASVINRKANHLHLGINPSYKSFGWGRGKGYSETDIINEGWKNPTTFLGITLHSKN